MVVCPKAPHKIVRDTVADIDGIFIMTATDFTAGNFWQKKDLPPNKKCKWFIVKCFLLKTYLKVEKWYVAERMGDSSGYPFFACL